MPRPPGSRDLSENDPMLQGAVGSVRLVEEGGVVCVEKRMADPDRHDTEVLALRALERSDLPVPRVVRAEPGTIVMTRMPGERLDLADPAVRLARMREAMGLLRRLHALRPPDGLQAAPDDAAIVRAYREAGGPLLPLVVPPSSGSVFCHGDWTDGNVLAVGDAVTAVVDWEAAHVGDPMRELSRAVYGAMRKDPASFDALADGYGADPEVVRAWLPIHAAEMWLWFAQAGPPEYLERLTAELHDWR